MSRSDSGAPARIIDVTCDFCGASAGIPCLSVGGKPKAYPHMRRANAFWGAQSGEADYDRFLAGPGPGVGYLDDALSLFVERESITEELRKKARKLGSIDPVKLGIAKHPEREFQPGELDLFRAAITDP